MKKLNKSICLHLIFAIFALVCLIGGIFMIIFGAKANKFMLVAGIIAVIFGFYGSPILFINYGSNKQMKRIVYAIEVEKLYSAQEIAKQLQMSEAEVTQIISNAVVKNYITGYKFDGTNLTINKKVNTVTKKKCPNCGGKLVEENGKLVCHYCDTTY